ncbi:MAG: PTS sugar transporter subunit IIC [Tindallia sp. MSAO_Bac2]|nr:MAG: PTS sugar transporter subunit IIC [Tindallia sp. MSAO_Bac2]
MKSFKAFLRKKNIEFSLKRYGIEALGAMALGLFASLIVGLILNVLGEQLGLEVLEEMGSMAMSMAGPAIGVAVAYGLKAPPLVMFTSAVTGMAGYQMGGPAGCFVAAVIGAEFGKLVSGETRVDIVVTPVITMVTGVLTGMFIGPVIGGLMVQLGALIMVITEIHPLPMGMLIAVIVGMSLTLPISSAALCIMLDLSGIAAGAATVGCCCQMIGFAVSGYKDNGVGGLISQGLGTSMLQIPNIVRNPLIWIPPTVASAIIGPLSTTVLRMENVPTGAGMGTSGLVGQFGTVEAMGMSGEVIMKIGLLHFLLPAVVTYIIYRFMRQKGWIKDGDMKLDRE